MTGALSSLRQKLLVQCGALGVLLPLSYLLARPLLEGLDWGAVHHALGQIGLVNWAIAIAATIGSFAALGRYDVVVHRHLGTRQPERAVQLSGAAAVGLAQFLGLGLITGTIARWRALPGLGAARAGAVTALVSVSFLLAWLGLFGAAGLILPHSIPMPPYVFAACLISALLLVLYTCLRRTIGVGGARIRLPSLYALGAMAGFAALDTALAGLAFWVLIPAGADITYAAFLPIYLAGLGIALISNTPGGVGPFELTLLWALQDTDLSSVLAGLIAFRLLYFAAPAVIAGIYLAVLPSREPPAPARSPRVLRTPQAALHPEAQVAAQGGAILTEAASGVPLAPVRRTGQVTVSLFDPPCGFDRLRPALVRSANAYANWPLAYKISAQSAFKARRAGWSVLRIADDAIIDTARWSTQGRAYATLRRKLRKAASASLTITYTAPHSEPSQRFWQDLARIDAAWCAHAGGARGFSMGRFDPAYLSQQHLCVAWQDASRRCHLQLFRLRRRGCWAV